MDELELLKYNSMGLVPGPQETETAYASRVEFCLKLKKEYFPQLSLPYAAPLDAEVEKKLLAPALKTTKNLYDCAPDWIPLFFSNLQLYPWYGGAAWIFQLQKESPLGAFLQLRKVFFSQDTLLKIYHRDELIAHELSHVGRMAFEEKKFEELFAYRTSNRPFSRTFGPLLQSAFESKLMVFLIATLLLMDLFILALGSFDAYANLFPLKVIPFILILWGLYRLRQRNKTLDKAHLNLEALWGDHAKPILYRLTDKEIERFANSSPDQIKHYAETEPSLRWRTIRSAYGS